jgi:hypothetical protein
MRPAGMQSRRGVRVLKRGRGEGDSREKRAEALWEWERERESMGVWFSTLGSSKSPREQSQRNRHTGGQTSGPLMLADGPGRRPNANCERRVVRRSFAYTLTQTSPVLHTFTTPQPVEVSSERT